MQTEIYIYTNIQSRLKSSLSQKGLVTEARNKCISLISNF